MNRRKAQCSERCRHLGVFSGPPKERCAPRLPEPKRESEGEKDAECLFSEPLNVVFSLSLVVFFSSVLSSPEMAFHFRFISRRFFPPCNATCAPRSLSHTTPQVGVRCPAFPRLPTVLARC